tara:strand:+ start:148 stop:609 length:462 start_codon:yes stop_codon:yes gene_type:complete
MTPFHAWEDIKEYIPKNRVIWEAFYGDGESGKYLTDLGFNTIHQDIDFFENDLGEIIVSNPPYSKVPKILARLKSLNKPFILIMPSSKVNTQYFRKLFLEEDDRIQLIVPKRRIHFIKLVDGEVPKNWKNACNFDCFYYCWKIGLERDLTWLS